MTAKARIIAKLEEFRGYLSELEGMTKISWDDFQADLLKKRGIERTLQLTVEALIELGSNIIAAKQWRSPVSNRDIFAILTEQGVLDNKLGEAIAKMVGFRNILVHDYTRIDDTVVYGVLHGQLADIIRFYDIIRKYLL